MPTGQVLTHEGRSLALVDLGKDASAALRASWSADQPLQSGGAMNGSWVLPALGASSTAASSLMAGNVFLATAHPGTLMTIGTGVGSVASGVLGINRNPRSESVGISDRNAPESPAVEISRKTNRVVAFEMRGAVRG